MNPDSRKVYLSKSKQADSYVISMMKHYLVSLGFVVVEHEQGTEYDEGLLGTAETMIMIGYDFSHSPEVGKGQYTQLLAREARSLHRNYYLVKPPSYDLNGNIVPDSIMLLGVLTDHVIDTTSWQEGYGRLHIDKGDLLEFPTLDEELPACTEADDAEIERLEDELYEVQSEISNCQCDVIDFEGDIENAEMQLAELLEEERNLKAKLFGTSAGNKPHLACISLLN